MAWPKHLSVDKRIILLLSASTYESFPRALREIVSNSYDADATHVEIELSTKDRPLAVTDNGSGMTPEEFDFFLRIAGRQRSRTRTTVLGRKRIGQFGIGFLAMFPFCEIVEVESTVAGSSVVFRARIPAARFCTETAKIEDVTAADVTGKEFTNDKLRNEHYTKFRLVHTTPLLRRYLTQRVDKKKFRNSIRSYSGMARLQWELEDILPVRLPDTSVIASYVDPDPADFNVRLDGKLLVANDSVEDVLAHSDGEENVAGIEFRYAIGTPWKAVRPDEARGLRVRLNHVGVGPRQYFDLGIAGRTFSRLHWLTGEVNILSGLDEAITLDRDSFTAAQGYDDFRDFFRSKLRELAFFVEDVDEAKRKITAQTRQSARAETAPSADVVAHQIARLEKRGFTIRRTAAPTSPKRSASVDVDTKDRVVTVRGSVRESTDKIQVAGRTWNVKYGHWDPTTDRHKGCRFIGPRTLELNQDYPLFLGVNKDVFRRLQILLAQAERDSKNKRDLFEQIQRLLLEEFEG